MTNSIEQIPCWITNIHNTDELHRADVDELTVIIMTNSTEQITCWTNTQPIYKFSVGPIGRAVWVVGLDRFDAESVGSNPV
jgi:hypothetical protein